MTDDYTQLRSDFWALQEALEKAEAKLTRVRALERELAGNGNDISGFFAAVLRRALEDG